jgi:peptidoglycan hydrolase-like protein with peptidoglycan-binding domain
MSDPPTGPAQRGYIVDVNGEFDPGTEAVVRQFQADVGLDRDGEVGPRTRQALGSSG